MIISETQVVSKDLGHIATPQEVQRATALYWAERFRVESLINRRYCNRSNPEFEANARAYWAALFQEDANGRNSTAA